MKFYQILFQEARLAGSTYTALIGGGGKSALLTAMGRELSEHYPHILLTSITKSQTDSPFRIEYYKNVNQQIDDPSIKKENLVFVVNSKISRDKFQGISEAQLTDLLSHFDLCLFESDGARNKSLKAHNNIDPIVPKCATHLIIVAGADVVGTSLSDGFVHRNDLFRENWRIGYQKKLSPEFVAEVISTKKGYLSKLSHQLVVAYFINKAEKYGNQAVALARAVKLQTESPVYYGSIKSNWVKEYK